MQKSLLASDVRVWREHDARGVNVILNHPEVRPWVADTGAGDIDLTPAVENQNNILLMGEHGAIFWQFIMPGTYECHTQVLPAGRGPWAHKFAIAVLDWMFTRSNAWEATTRVPRGHIAALALAKSVGFEEEFVAMDPCRFRGRLVPATTLTLSIHKWMSRSAGYATMGSLLHQQMATEALRLGIAVPSHADDLHHDQVAGASIEMVRHGLTVKGIHFYNRWAALSRHRMISLVSSEPLVVQMDLGQMRIRETGIEITP